MSTLNSSIDTNHNQLLCVSIRSYLFFVSLAGRPGSLLVSFECYY